MEDNDYELLYYVHQKNEEAFNLLVDKYEKYIYYMINLFKKEYYFFAYEDSDLYNESLLLLYDCIYSYNEAYNVKFSSFYLACLKRKLISFIRSLSSNKNKSHALAISLDYNPKDEDLNLYDVIDNKQLAVNEKVSNDYILNLSLEKLKTNMNQLEIDIVYYYLMGYSYQEIKKILNTHVKKVDNTLQKYRKIVKYSEIKV